MRTCLVVATALLLAVAARADPAVCSGYKATYKTAKGAITKGPGLPTATTAAQLLAARIAAEVHKDEDCVVEPKFKVERACRRPVKKDEFLRDSGFTVKRSGVMYDMQILSTVTCPDGSFKVRYQARGVQRAAARKPLSLKKLFDIQTRFMDVIDSTYV